jgi:crotonobetainyl-CoA:carnitine CoA-transferase CaiB-like acyl-CoA transferase
MTVAVRPLAGLQVLSLAEQYPGPFASLLLADLGADVLLVERPDGGDPSRRYAAFFAALNRGKRSVALDLKQPGALAACRSLVARSDVLLEGFRPGVMRRLGLGHEELRREHPGLIYVSISGFGQDGPYRDRPAHDLSYQAMAGLLQRHDPAAAAEPPMLSLADLTAGLFGAIAVLTGLAGRASTGQGGYYDVSMFDAVVSLLTTKLVPLLNGAVGDEVAQDPAYGLFATRDGRLLSLSVSFEDHFWRRLCEHTGLPELAGLTADERTARRTELREVLARVLAGRTLAEWEAAFEDADLPFGAVRSVESLSDDVQVVARGLLQDVTDACGTNRYLRQPLTVDGTRPGPRGGVPLLGEHTVGVLADAGWPAEDIDRLLRDGAAAAPQLVHAPNGSTRAI